MPNASMLSLAPETFFESTLTSEQKKPVRICSVYPKEVAITHGARTILVPECREGMRVAMSEPLGPGTEQRDYGNAQKVVLENISSRDYALDAIGLTRPRMNSRGQEIEARTTSDWWESGFFVPEGPDGPSDAEIAAARARLKRWAEKWVNKGDEAFAVDQKPARVDFRAKLAARILKIRRGWSEGMTATVETTQCPSCRNQMNAGATKCAVCGDRFVYVDGKPVLADGAAMSVAGPSAPPPGKGRP